MKTPFLQVALLAAVVLTAAAGCQPRPGSLVDTVPPPPAPKQDNGPYSIFNDVPRYSEPVRQTSVDQVARVETADPKARQTVPVAADPAWIPGQPTKWTYIIVHHSAQEFGNAAIYDRAHRMRGWDELGYHFVITNGHGDTDGRVEIGPRWIKQKHGAHARVDPNDDNRWNEHGIGICLVGDFNKHRPSEAQLNSAARLVAYLMQECNIPRSRIYGHGQIPGAKTDCPGRQFPYDDLFRRADALRE